MAKTKSGAQQALTLQRRDERGTRPARRLRRAGLVPGVVYGKNAEPLAVTVAQGDLTKLLHSKAGEHALVTLRLDGAGAWEKPALVQSIQHDPVDGHVVHVDFHTILLTERLRVKVPLVLKGEPVGVKQEGGLLEHFLRDVEVECLPTDIPTSIEFDVSALKIGDTVHVRDLPAPKQAKITSDPEGVIASIHLPKVEKPEEEAAAAVTEPEVIREKKEEAEGAEAEAAKAEPARPAGPPGAKAGAGGAGDAKKESKSS
jgi:large subunit ribosomal protein L25